ncbi:MAG: hypothetical protein HYR60_26870 [Acidobacteria bacterium]|nr:hypothetical protein [Acidobacteriota bacterium]
MAGTLTIAVWEMPPAEAVTVALWVVAGVPAVAVKVALLAPEATVTEAGTVSAALLLDRLTAKPPPAATLFSVTVHVPVADGLMAAGQDNADNCTGAVSVSEKLRDMPAMLAVSWAVVSTATAAAVAVNVALTAPPGTVTEAGTVTPALLEERETAMPPADAGKVSVTVHVEVAGP